MLQKRAEEGKGKEVPPFLLDGGRHCKEAGDEGALPAEVAFAHSACLSLAKQVHHLLSLQRSPCPFQGKEAHPRLE
jgi:hypothetical protein